MKIKYSTIGDIIDLCLIDEYNKRAYILGYLRYEALRKLTPQGFYKLWEKNIKGKNFDEMVNELVIKNHNNI